MRENLRGEHFMDSLASPKTCLEVSRHNIIHDLFEIYNTNDNEKIVAIKFTEEDAYREGVKTHYFLKKFCSVEVWFKCDSSNKFLGKRGKVI